jgi:hypothetical protein
MGNWMMQAGEERMTLNNRDTWPEVSMRGVEAIVNRVFRDIRICLYV